MREHTSARNGETHCKSADGGQRKKTEEMWREGTRKKKEAAKERHIGHRPCAEPFKAGGGTASALLYEALASPAGSMRHGDAGRPPARRGRQRDSSYCGHAPTRAGGAHAVDGRTLHPPHVPPLVSPKDVPDLPPRFDATRHRKHALPPHASSTRLPRACTPLATAASLQPVGRVAALTQRPRRTRGATRRAAACPPRTSHTASVEHHKPRVGGVRGATRGRGGHVRSTPYKWKAAEVGGSITRTKMKPTLKAHTSHSGPSEGAPRFTPESELLARLRDASVPLVPLSRGLCPVYALSALPLPSSPPRVALPVCSA